MADGTASAAPRETPQKTPPRARAAKARPNAAASGAPAGAFDFSSVRDLHSETADLMTAGGGAALRATAAAVDRWADFAGRRGVAVLDLARASASCVTPDDVLKTFAGYSADAMEAYGSLTAAIMQDAAEAVRKAAAEKA